MLSTRALRAQSPTARDGSAPKRLGQLGLAGCESPQKMPARTPRPLHMLKTASRMSRTNARFVDCKIAMMLRHRLGPPHA